MASKKTSQSQSKTRVAFIGCGGIAAKHTRRMKDMAEVEIVGGCDLKKQLVKGLWGRTWQEDTPAELPPAFVDTGSMYRECKPDAVVICSPHTLHFEQANEDVRQIRTSAEKVIRRGDRIKDVQLGEETPDAELPPPTEQPKAL